MQKKLMTPADLLPRVSLIMSSLLVCLTLLSCNKKEAKSTSLDQTPAPLPQTEEPTEVEEPIISQELQDGDLIFHTSQSDQSLAIQIATNSLYSHMGIIYLDEGETFVYEAVQPVKITAFEEWVNRGKDGKYVVKRLRNSQDYLSKNGIDKMKTIGKRFLSKDYDLQFEWSDDKIYCSELVWKMYKEAFDIEIGTLEQIKDFDLSDPVVQAKLKERYGNNIPLEEYVITPDRMFQANNLITVVEK